MVLFAFVVCGFVFVAVAVQSAVVAAFASRLLRAKPSSASAKLPKAAVVLSLRGPDPFLHQTLDGLMNQEYPEYEVFLVVDSQVDPVWNDVTPFVDEDPKGRIHVSVLREPLKTCSLKCSSLVQAVSELDDSFEVVAFLDGDAPPHPTWLRDLVTPLQDPKVGVATGNRWYAPNSGEWGSMVRYLWNIGAVVQVWLNKIVWAGSMATRADTIRKTGMLNAWRSALSVDGTVCRVMKEKRQKVTFVPQVMMLNEEETTMPSFHRWVQRQLIAAKSCGSEWRMVIAHALSLVATQALTVTAIVASLVAEHWLAFGLSVGALTAYWISAIGAAWLLEISVRRIVRDNGHPIQWHGWRPGLRFLPAMMLTHVAYPYALVTASFRRNISWRGVEYEINGPGRIAMKAYRPYRAASHKQYVESVI